VETLGISCFVGCVCLSEVRFDNNSTLSQVGNFVFSKCPSLSSIRIPASLGGFLGEYQRLPKIIDPEGSSPDVTACDARNNENAETSE
jgi:hypothetical protein